jgi:TonB family protein
MVSSTQSQIKHEVKTDGTGRFELVGLPAGEYLLETSSPGFGVARETVTLSPGQLMSKNVALQLGSLQETIMVIDSDNPSSTVRRAAARPASPAPCVAKTVGGNIKPPMKVVDVKPKYPANLRESRASGQVELEATIGPDGSVTDAQVVSSPYADMSAAAIEAVRQWQFTPTLLNCAPVNVNMHVTAGFRPQE